VLQPADLLTSVPPGVMIDAANTEDKSHYKTVAIKPVISSPLIVPALSFNQQFTPWYPSPELASSLEGLASSLTPLHFLLRYWLPWLHASTHCLSEYALNPMMSKPWLCKPWKQSYLSPFTAMMLSAGQVVLISVMEAGGT
jgi:hypothetical protein